MDVGLVCSRSADKPIGQHAVDLGEAAVATGYLAHQVKRCDVDLNGLSAGCGRQEVEHIPEAHQHDGPGCALAAVVSVFSTAIPSVVIARVEYDFHVVGGVDAITGRSASAEDYRLPARNVLPVRGDNHDAQGRHRYVRIGRKRVVEIGCVTCPCVEQISAWRGVGRDRNYV